MSLLAERLFGEIRRIPIIDPHTHIDPRRAASRSLDDLLGYHYYTELAHSAGMDAAVAGPAVEPRERASAIAPFLPRLANTVQYSWLLAIARDLLEFPVDRIGPENWEEVWDAAERKMSGPGWEEEVLARSNIERVFLTNSFDDPLEGFDTRRYVPCLRTDDLVFKLHLPAVRERLAGVSGAEVTNLRTLREALERVMARFLSKGARACAISLPPDFRPFRERPAAVEAALGGALAGQETTPSDRDRIARGVLWLLVDLASAAGLPFDLMIGASRDVYPAGVPQGTDLFDRRCSLFEYRELFNAFPRTTFPVSVLAHDQNPELVAYAWIFPNVVAHGHWWYSNIPAYIALDARARLQAVPRTKQIAYYSDMYKLEFGLPKFDMYRRVLAGILAEDFVEGRGWDEEAAVDLARGIIRDNVERIFALGDRDHPAGGRR
jgi:glucuronate isomerase